MFWFTLADMCTVWDEAQPNTSGKTSRQKLANILPSLPAPIALLRLRHILAPLTLSRPRCRHTGAGSDHHNTLSYSECWALLQLHPLRYNTGYPLIVSLFDNTLLELIKINNPIPHPCLLVILLSHLASRPSCWPATVSRRILLTMTRKIDISTFL